MGVDEGNLWCLPACWGEGVVGGGGTRREMRQQQLLPLSPSKLPHAKPAATPPSVPKAAEGLSHRTLSLRPHRASESLSEQHSSQVQSGQSGNRQTETHMLP